MSKSDSTVVPFTCEDCGVEIYEGEEYTFFDEKIRCPKCYEEYIKLKESKRKEATKIENYL